jgi:Tol biopolymer transport system component
MNNNRTSEVYSIKSDSATPIKLATVKFPIRHIAWSPDSSWLIIDGDVNRTGGGDTFRVSLDGSGTTPWLSDGFQAVWSLDGSRVAFATQRNRPRIDIYVMNADGSGQTKLNSDDPCNLGPTWIP